MLIVTNRNINETNFKDGIGDEKAFGDEINSKGPNEVRIAHAKKKNGKWEVKLIEEPAVLTPDNLPSKREFKRFREKLIKKGKNCVFFVHGFNQSFKKNLEKSFHLQEEHGVEVIAFSWPSNPGGFITKEYHRAKRDTKASVGALDSTLEKLGGYLSSPARL